MSCNIFDPLFLAKTGVLQKTVIANGSGVKKYAEWCIRIPKSSTDDPKTAISYLFDDFLTEAGEGPGP